MTTANLYQQRIEAKKEYYQGMAERKSAEASAIYNQAHKMAEHIPFGQPILVGHHSESRDRNFRNRITSKFEKSFETQKTAEYYAEKAKTVGTGGISSLDPDAIILLQEKLAKCEENQVKMVQANKLIRKNDREGLVKIGFSESAINKLFTPDFCGRLGFPSFATQNNNAEIRRLKQRIAELSKKAEAETVDPVKVESKLYDYTEEDGRCQFEFNGKPSEEIRNILKENAFKWSPSRGTWVRQNTANGQWASRRVMEKLNQIEV